MKIHPVQSFSVSKGYVRQNTNNETPVNGKDLPILEYMHALSCDKKINFQGARNFTINLNSDELKIRTDKEHFTEFKMLDVNAPQYTKLDDNDKKCLKHLVRAGRCLNDVFLKQDNHHNIEFREYLKKEIAKGNADAQKALLLFNAQKGINAKDYDSKDVQLAAGIPVLPGKGVYPEDLKEKEFHNILIKMLENGETEEVRNILSLRTVVERNGNKLTAVDYTQYYKKEFQNAAQELEKASEYTTDCDFREYLILQSKSLKTNNYHIDALADKKWAELQHSPLEFTISRESYDDRLTMTVLKNPVLKNMLDEKNITPYAKDFLGVRVGILNREGTDYLLKMKSFLPLMAKNIPYSDEPCQTAGPENIQQTMTDVDIVEVTGHNSAFRGKISLASNLPNDDKPVFLIGGGKKNVYNIQMRESKYGDGIEKRLNALLDKSQHKYFNVKALHDFTILHENLHSLGPKNNVQLLGNYKNTLEENKADMGALAMLDLLTEKGFYTEQQKKEIIVSYITAYIFKNPDFDSAHRLRNIIQHNYLIQNNAIEVTEDGKMKIDIEKVVPAAKTMFDEIVKIQNDGDIEAAQNHIKKYAVWTPELEKISASLRKADIRYNSYLSSPLADRLCEGD